MLRRRPRPLTSASARACPAPWPARTALLAALRATPPGRACGWCPRPAWAPATAPRPARSATSWWSTRRRTASPRGRAGPPALPTRPASTYLARGGYAALRAARAAGCRATPCWRGWKPAALRGLGGAGFPAARKWRLVLAQPGAAPPGGQRRRGRARHLQGPLLPGDRAAPGAGGHAAGGAGHRAERLLDLSARRIPASPPHAATRDRGAGGGGAGAHADPSAPRRRRLYLRRGDGAAGEPGGHAAAIRATSRPSRARRACSAGRR